MFCPCRDLLNPGATLAALPEPQCPRSSGAAGCFTGPLPSRRQSAFNVGHSGSPDDHLKADKFADRSQKAGSATLLPFPDVMANGSSCQQPTVSGCLAGVGGRQKWAVSRPSAYICICGEGDVQSLTFVEHAAPSPQVSPCWRLRRKYELIGLDEFPPT